MTRLRAVATLALIIGAAACIDDPAAVDDQFALTQEDAALLGLNFWRDALEAAIDLATQGPSGAPAAAPQQAPEVFTTTDTVMVACALGGDVETIVDATLILDVDTGALELDAGFTITHDGCREQLEGQTFSFYGAPNIVVELMDASDGSGGRVVSGSIQGAAVVITEGAPVLCTMDVTAGPSAVQGNTLTYPIRGTFCGQSMDETVTEPIG